MKENKGGNLVPSVQNLTNFHLPLKGVHPLMNTEKGRRWLSAIDNAHKRDIYTYQPTLDHFLKTKATIDGKTFTVFSSYDYLGLIGNSEINFAAEQAIRQFGTGTGGVRLLTGTFQIHRACEAALATFMRSEDAVTFTSGYMANLALFTSINDHETLFIVDSLIHRSILDSLKLANANIKKFHHNDIESLENILLNEESIRRKIIVTEGIFSMEGDIPPLPEIVALKKKYHCFLILDESHSLGVLGRYGRGITEHFGIDPREMDAITCSLSKTIPANGGCVAGSQDLIAVLQHDSSPFIFSGSMSPPMAAVVMKSLEVIEKAVESREILFQKAKLLRRHIQENGFSITDSLSPIVPLMVGDDESTYRLTKWMKEKNIIVSPVVYPAVNRGKSRLRLCVNVDHAMEDIRYFSACLQQFKTWV